MNNKRNLYNAIDSGDSPYSTRILNMLCPAPSELELKLNAQVMLIKFLDVGNNLVNGSRGCVVGFNENKLPIVKFMNGTEMVIKYDSWSFNLNSFGQTLSRKQLPLQLAWAISIHKSQVIIFHYYLYCKFEIKIKNIF